MSKRRVEFGLTLANRGILMEVTTVDELFRMADIAEQSDVFDWIWVGDNILAKPRLEAVALLSAVAARTKKLRMGPACMASISLRNPILFACQWASLDVISGGRTVLVACTGLGEAESQGNESHAFGMEKKDRPARMEEQIEILKLLWTEDHVSFDGKYYRFEDVSLRPKPAQKPRPPIWIAVGSPAGKFVERSQRRVARLGDGFMKGGAHPEEYAANLQRIKEYMVEYGRDPSTLYPSLYYNININENTEAAFEESTRFLNTYYMTRFKPDAVERWLAYGSPDQCISKLRRYADVGIKMITLRVTSWDQMGQLKRCMEEVLPHVT